MSVKDGLAALSASGVVGPPFKLNLGCCDRRIPGHLGVDCVAGPNVDVVADLNERWPWDDSTVAEIVALDIIEHLLNETFTMNEAFRVLSPGGVFQICIPTTDGQAAFQDPTHRTYWNRHKFWYYEENNPYRERFARSYGITARFHVRSERPEMTLDGPKLWITLEKPAYCD